MHSLTGVALPLVKERLLGDVWLRDHELVGCQRQRQVLHNLPGTHAVAQLQPRRLLEGLQACHLGQHLHGAKQQSTQACARVSSNTAGASLREELSTYSVYKAHSQLTTHLHLLLGCQLCWRLAQDHLHSRAGCRHHEAHATQGLAGLLVAQKQQQLPCAAHVAGLQADLQRRVLIQYALRVTSTGKPVTMWCVRRL